MRGERGAAHLLETGHFHGELREFGEEVARKAQLFQAL